MRVPFRHIVTVAEDGLSAMHSGAAFARSQYRDSRRLRSESASFAAAFATASSIGGWLGRGEAESLFEFAGAVRAGYDVVEVGSYLGRSTAFLALGVGPGCTVHSVDPHTGDRSQVEQGLQGIDTSQQFERNMAAMGVKDKVEAHVMISVEAAKCYRGRPVGLLFVDGWHTEQAVYEDGHAWFAHMASDALVAFDDIADPEVARGVHRLVEDGVLPQIAGTVGKIGLCGPPARWPTRVAAIARMS
jgi:predicted O-methyltransferase YrrM